MYLVISIQYAKTNQETSEEVKFVGYLFFKLKISLKIFFSGSFSLSSNFFSASSTAYLNMRTQAATIEYAKRVPIDIMLANLSTSKIHAKQPKTIASIAKLNKTNNFTQTCNTTSN